MSIVGSSSLSPLDAVMMLSTRRVPNILVAGKALAEDNCVFIFNSSNVLSNSRRWLEKKSGAVLLLDVDIELHRWRLDSLPTGSTGEDLETFLANSFGRIVLGKRSSLEDQVLLSLQTSDSGIMKDIMSVVYTVKKSDVREKVKRDILTWVTSSQKPEALIEKILGNISKPTDETLRKLREFEKCIRSGSILKLRHAFTDVKRGSSVEESSSLHGVESFEMMYIQKYLSKSK